jgi:hypothetical protein
VRDTLRRYQVQPAVEAILIRDYNRACLFHGLWADRRAKATKTITLPKPRPGAAPKGEVPLYTTLPQILGLDTARRASAANIREHPTTDAERTAAALLNDPDAMAAFMASVMG